MSDTRVVFADQLAPGDTLTDPCRSGGVHICGVTATRHGPDHVHERTILAVRTVDDLVSAIAVDEDGEQQPLGYGRNATVRILVRDTLPAAEPVEEAPLSE